MGSGYYAQLRDILLANGCEFVRQGKGSHEIWQSPISGKRFPVPVTVLARPMANTVLRQAGIGQRL